MNQVTRWDPFENLFKDFRCLVLQPVDLANNPDVPALKVDVKEDKDAYTVHADLPGVAKDDIHVNIEGSVVSWAVNPAVEHPAVDQRDRVLRLRADGSSTYRHATGPLNSAGAASKPEMTTQRVF